MNPKLTAALLNDCSDALVRNQTRQTQPAFPAIPPIPVGRYTDQALWDLEQKHLWTRTWICAGHVDELPEIGSFKLWRDAGVPIVLIRGKDQIIRAFYNTCMHRGGPLVHEEKGKTPTLWCKFHRWSYDLEGCLKSVPDEHEFPNLKKEEVRLGSVRCELWGNFVFINRDPQAIPLLEFLGPLVEEFRDLKMETRRVYKTAVYDLQSNWKIAVASNVESYHVPPVHPGTVNQFLDYRALENYLYVNGHSQQVIARKGLGTENENAIFDRGEASLDPEHELTRKAVRNYFIFPNMLISAAEFQFPIVVYWPVDVRTTRWLVLYTAPEGRDDPESAECADLAAMLDIILQEDIANLVWMQQSYEAGLIDSIRISYAERRIAHFEEEVDRRIGRSKIPDHLRVLPVLEPYIIDPNDVLTRRTDERQPHATAPA